MTHSPTDLCYRDWPTDRPNFSKAAVEARDVSDHQLMAVEPIGRPEAEPRDSFAVEGMIAVEVGHWFAAEVRDIELSTELSVVVEPDLVELYNTLGWSSSC